MNRIVKNAAKRRTILDAALQVFSAKGFAAARVEDIAREAGVAKGTIYVHFADKEAVFAAILHELLAPVHVACSTELERADTDLRTRLWSMVQPIMADNGQSQTGMAIRLIYAEGLHNPALVRPYLDLIEGSMSCLHMHMKAAGLPAQVYEHPQLVMAPLLHGLLWQKVFGDTRAMNLSEMYAAYLDMLFAAGPRLPTDDLS